MEIMDILARDAVIVELASETKNDVLAELAQMEPVEVDFRIFRDNEMRQLMGLLTWLLNHIHEQSEHEQSEHEQSEHEQSEHEQSEHEQSK